MAPRDNISIAEFRAVLEQRLQQLGDTGVHAPKSRRSRRP